MPLVARKHKDVPSPDEWTAVEKYTVQCTFVLLGVACLAIWGGLLNMLHDLEHLIYPGFELGDTILATCMTTVLAMTITWIALDRVSIRLVYASCVGITLCCFLIAICVAFIPGKAGVVCLHLVALLIGVCKGTLYPMSFGLAGVMPVDKGGACAVGLGLAGVYSLILYLTLTVWGVTVVTYEDLIPPFWIFCTLLSLPSILGPVLLYWILHRPAVYGNMGATICGKLGLPVLDPNADHGHLFGNKSVSKDIPLNGPAATSMSSDPLNKDLEKLPGQKSTGASEVPNDTHAEEGIKTADADDVEDPEEMAKVHAWNALGGRDKMKQFLADVWKPCLSVGWAFFVTLQLYPNVGPLAWEDGRINSLYMMACFQGLEYISRTGCDIWDWQPGGKKPSIKEAGISGDGTLQPAGSQSGGGFAFKPFYMFKPFGINFLVSMVSIRTIFIPLFVFCMIWPDSPFWGALWWHYVLCGLCGFTLGWAGSLAVYYAPNSLKPDKPKFLRMRAGQAMVFCSNFGIWIALWIGKLYFL